MQTRRILVTILMSLIKLCLVVMIAIGIYRLGEYAYVFGHSIYDDVAMSDPPGQDITIVLPEGSSVGQVAQLLEVKGLIRDDKVFMIQERLSQYHGQIQAGNFVLNTSQSAQDILAILSGHAQDVQKEEEDE